MNYNQANKSNILNLIGRDKALFKTDLATYQEELHRIISKSRFLVLGGAGTIGQAVVKALFEGQAQKLHVVDLSENNLVELVRDLRSSFGYIDGDFKTYALDIGSIAYDAFIASDGNYDYVLNLAALKHVRSEEDPFTLMRMLEVNIVNTVKTIDQSIAHGVKKYFSVSTDKATAPINMMGASKRIMELFLVEKSKAINISTARFANVAFSDGSLLHGFEQRIKKQQPLVAPNDVQRYFISPEESGQLCLMSCLLGDQNELFLPQLHQHLKLTRFSDIAVNYIKHLGYIPYLCHNEDEARTLAKTLPASGQWPYLLTKSNTTGEKAEEAFFTAQETLDLERFTSIGVIKQKSEDNLSSQLQDFTESLQQLKATKSWTKPDLIALVHKILPNFNHEEKGTYLDHKM
ncbi:UDP-N-acetylglucosamine 4,6-dehydratase [Winogradskyella rapida]|uniref:UDP-N-acetylglucosamine 4,6-dehydratase n=1 Tax=Winogradskyella rapida TaxID=549701 RepID=A0ABW3KUT4_9FLAO